MGIKMLDNSQFRKKKDNLIDGSPILEIMHILFKVGLSGIKSFVYALSQIIWIFAGITLFGAGLLYLIKSGDIKTLTELPKGLGIIMEVFKNNWVWFFLGIWTFDFIINFREINKDE
jgi:hypothetical protein